MPASMTKSVKATVEVFRGRGAGLRTANPYHRQETAQYDWAGLDAALDENPTTKFLPTYPKEIVNVVHSPDIGLALSANPYQGCEHGCAYCYARNSHEFWGYSAGLDFEQTILYKPEAAQLLEATLCRRGWEPKPIALSGNTDCYQPAERKFGLTRAMLEVLLRYKHPVGLITKNALILRDLDLLQDLARMRLVHVYISLTTQDEELRRALEPRTASFAKRIETIRVLTQHGIPCGAMIAPMIPGLNEHEAPELIAAAADAGALAVGYTIVRLNGRVAEVFEDWLHRQRPNHASKVLKQIAACHGGKVNDSQFGRRMVGDGPVAAAIGALIRKAREQHLGARSMPSYDLTRFCPPQGRILRLF